MSPVIRRYIIERIVYVCCGAYKIFVLLIIIHELILIINLQIFFCVKKIFNNFPIIYLLRFSHLLITNEHKIFKQLIAELTVVCILNLHLLFSSHENKCVNDIPTYYSVVKNVKKLPLTRDIKQNYSEQKKCSLINYDPTGLQP